MAFRADRRGDSAVFWPSLLALLAPMVAWKLRENDFSVAFNLWGNGVLERISYPLWVIDLARTIVIPIGLSFATFRAVDLLVKTYVGKIGALSFGRVFFYGFFPPVQMVGPIITYEEVETYKRPDGAGIYQGLLRISFGLVKVLMVASFLKRGASIFETYGSAPVSKIWAYLFLYTWFFYINFSGYSDLAIGIARLYGYSLSENFCFPFFRRNVAEFWNNWHMSLSRFAQRNAFIPLGGYRKRTLYPALFATMAVIALWHNLSWGMVVFALYHGGGLAIHRFVNDRAARTAQESSTLANWMKIAGTYLFVTLSFPLLALPLGKAWLFYLSLAGLDR